MPYKSSSHDDVFEIRNRIADAKAMSVANEYVKMNNLQEIICYNPDADPDAIAEGDDDFVDHAYIIPAYEPY